MRDDVMKDTGENNLSMFSGLIHSCGLNKSIFPLWSVLFDF